MLSYDSGTDNTVTIWSWVCSAVMTKRVGGRGVNTGITEGRGVIVGPDMIGVGISRIASIRSPEEGRDPLGWYLDISNEWSSGSARARDINDGDGSKMEVS